jgi:hypothetical protein
MADRLEKQKRKAVVAAWKAENRAAARAKFPLPEEQLLALFDALYQELSRWGCDRTLRLVRECCHRIAVAAGPVEDWLHNNGGHCDCEAFHNARQAFDEARREPGSQS